jgi:RNA polymerase sigma-70 factor (ECF subfamily)
LYELTQLCLDGDQLAVRELVSRFRNQVYGLCRRMLVHHQDAEDAAQETFVRALRYLETWDPARSFERWLLTIAGNRCRTALSKRQTRQTLALEHDPLDKTNDDGRAAQLAEEVSLALGNIRKEYRDCFLLFHQHHYSYEQIAAAMNHPVGTVKTWVHRARRDLMMLLGERGVIESSCQ